MINKKSLFLFMNDNTIKIYEINEETNSFDIQTTRDVKLECDEI